MHDNPILRAPRTLDVAQHPVPRSSHRAGDRRACRVIQTVIAARSVAQFIPTGFAPGDAGDHLR